MREGDFLQNSHHRALGVKGWHVWWLVVQKKKKIRREKQCEKESSEESLRAYGRYSDVTSCRSSHMTWHKVLTEYRGHGTGMLRKFLDVRLLRKLGRNKASDRLWHSWWTGEPLAHITPTGAQRQAWLFLIFGPIFPTSSTSGYMQYLINICFKRGYFPSRAKSRNIKH